VVQKLRYKPIYITKYMSRRKADKLKGELRKDGIEFPTFEEALRQIVKDIDEWKRNQVRKGA